MSSAQASVALHTSKRTERRERRRHHLAWLIDHRAQILATMALAAIAGGFLLDVAGADQVRDALWQATVALLAAELAVEVGRTVVVERSLGVDTIALVAMGGSLALGQELAGLVIGLMFSGGSSLEAIASRRARRELTALIQRAPKVAQRRIDDHLEEVPVDQLQIGDVVLVRTGDVVPVDGTILSREAVVDTSDDPTWAKPAANAIQKTACSTCKSWGVS